MTDTSSRDDDRGRDVLEPVAPDPRGRLLPLVPHLRAFARDLGNDDAAADGLVTDALAWALSAWDRLDPGDDLRSRLLDDLRERTGSVRPAGP